MAKFGKLPGFFSRGFHRRHWALRPPHPFFNALSARCCSSRCLTKGLGAQRGALRGCSPQPSPPVRRGGARRPALRRGNRAASGKKRSAERRGARGTRTPAAALVSPARHPRSPPPPPPRGWRRGRPGRRWPGRGGAGRPARPTRLIARGAPPRRQHRPPARPEVSGARPGPPAGRPPPPPPRGTEGRGGASLGCFCCRSWFFPE